MPRPATTAERQQAPTHQAAQLPDSNNNDNNNNTFNFIKVQIQNPMRACPAWG